MEKMNNGLHKVICEERSLIFCDQVKIISDTIKGSFSLNNLTSCQYDCSNKINSRDSKRNCNFRFTLKVY